MKRADTSASKCHCVEFDRNISELPALLSIPQEITGAASSNYACLYHKKDNTNPTYTLSFTGSLPVWALVTGLSKYTDYTFYAYYYGKRNSINDHHLISVTKTVKTHEDIPDAPPKQCAGHKADINVYKSHMGPASFDKELERHLGLDTGIQYAAKQSSPKVYKYIDVAGTGNRQRVVTLLNEYTYYEFQVAGYTSKGTGVYSAVVEERTKEDTPSAGPVNVTLTSATSRSLSIQWQDVVAEHRNGIITKYKLYYKQSYGSSSWTTVIINAPGKSYTITGLNLWTYYDIKVSAFTSVGEGVKSTYIRSNWPPQSLTTTSPSSQSVSAVWTAVHPTLTNGNISQYHVTCQRTDKRDALRNLFTSDKALTIYGLDEYVDYDIRVGNDRERSWTLYRHCCSKNSTKRHDPVGTWQSASVSSSDYTFVATGLKQYRLYDIKVAGLTIIGIGTFSSNIVVRTDADAPTRAPTNLTGNFIDHRSLNITCLPNVLNEEYGLFNKTVTGLKIYTPYVSESLDSLTSFPFVPPKNTTARVEGSTEIRLSWQSMMEIDGDANGKVLGYKIRYQVVDCYEDRPAVLRKFTEYSISVKVLNRKGEGNYSTPIRVKTDEDKPDAPPTLVETWPGTPESIRVYWSPIPQSLRNGIITGYRVFYKPLDVPMRQYSRSPRSVNQFADYGALPGEKMIQVNATAYQVEIEGLEEFKWYHMRIGAVTSKGVGIAYSFDATCQQRPPITAPDLHVIDQYSFNEITLKWSEISNASARGEVLGYRIMYKPIEQYDLPLPDYPLKMVNVFAPNRTGIIKELVAYTKYAISILAYTEGGIGISSDYSYGETCRCPKVFYSSRMIQPPMVDGHKAVSGILPKYVTEAIESCCGSCSRGHGKSYMNWTRDASGANPVKYTKSSLLDSIVAGTQVSLPLFQSTEEMTGSNNSLYYYVSFLPSPGITIFRRKPTDRELGNKGSEITSSAVYKQYPYLLIMSLERVRNKAEFPERFFCGTGTGMWYGDVTPVSKLGRLFTICWSLMGIILTGFVIGGITESLTTDIVFNGATVSVSSKILVSPEMYSVVKKEFKSELIIGNTSDPSYVVESLLTGRKVDASYGIALTAEGARIKHCVARYARENAQKILIELSNYSLTFESASSNKIELLEYMTSEHADITSNILKYGGILLALLVVVGLVYDLIKWTRQRAKVDGGTRACELLFKEFNNRVEGLFINLEENIDKIESRHATERVKLLEQDKNFHVTKLYPDLNLFDPTIPYKAPGRRTNAVPCAPSEEDESYPRAARLYPDLSRAHDSMGAEAPRFLDVTKAQNDDNDDDDDYGPLHPIDYKSSWCVCARYFGDLLGTSMLFLMPILMLQATGINALLSLPAIYQPGDGIYIERWVTSSSYGLDKFNQIPDYPNCPQYIQHHDNFEDTTMIRYQYHRVRVFFVSPQSGKHKFFLICNNKCRLSINLLPHEGWKKLIERSTITSDSWNDRITSPEITLMKDFRYMLELLHVGNGRFKDFFKVGVTFPDGTEVKPITKAYLKRSMEFYDWKGLLVQRYESVTINYDPLTTVNQFYTLNAAKYPANPSSYTCRSSLYDPQQYSSFGENYALRYIGFLRPMTTGVDSDYIRVLHKVGSGSDQTSWQGMLRNLLANETGRHIPPPNVTVLNSTAISVELPALLSIPPRDNWSSMSNYACLYHKKDNTNPTYTLSFTGSLPVWALVTGLSKYTDYTFYAYYYGKRNSINDHHLISVTKTVKTHEDIPDAPPNNVQAIKQTSTSIKVTWGLLPSIKNWNGIGLGYRIQYAAKQSSPKVYKYIDVAGTGNRQRVVTLLNEYTYYEFQVAGYTSKGTGVYSAVVEERTKEDTPSAGPVNVTLTSATSRSLSIQWLDVVAEHRNGIITKYKLYYKQSYVSSSWTTVIINAPGKSYTITGLNLWTYYDIKVSAFTSVGEGVKSTYIRVRTDEDKPTGPPQSLTTTSPSSQSVSAVWTAVHPTLTNGNISQYHVTCQRTDKRDALRNLFTSDKALTIYGLDEYVDYDIRVAGMTGKELDPLQTLLFKELNKALYDIKVAGLTMIGIGPFSSNIVVRTDADAPTRAPTNLTGNFIDHRSLNITCLPNVLNEEYGLFNKTVTGLKIYTPYVFRVAGFTYKAVGVYSEDLTVWTDEYIPFVPPKNTTARVEGSTEISLSWQSMMEIDGDANGKVLGYKIRYQVVDCYEDRPAGCSENEVFEITSLDPNSTISLSKLRKFTEYSISVKVLNRKGEGNYSTPIRVKTDEDKPDAPPTLVETWPGTPESIRVYWSPIPQSLRNGIITGYRVFYKPLDVPMRQYSRSPRSVNQFADYGALPREKMIQVNATTYEVELKVWKSLSGTI
eukprot:gene19880-21821_t